MHKENIPKGKITINVLNIDDTAKTGPLIANFVDGPPIKPFIDNEFKFTVHEKNVENNPRVLNASSGKLLYHSLPVQKDKDDSK